MGVSGAGKTILLHVLANRPTGDILVNGQPQNMASANTAGVGYQPDLQFPTATVREALIFSAQPKTTPYVEKIAYVEQPRKRLAIGIELAAKPTMLLLLDQPLSGLDSQAALSICALLRRLAQNGLAILCAINQPSARLLQSFDRLILLAKGGRQLYFGKIGLACKKVVRYFEHNGARPCLADENPVEWMFEVTGPVADSARPHDWAGTWNNSPGRKAVKSKLANLKEKFLGQLESVSVNGLSTSGALQHSAAEWDVIDLQRTYHRYLFLEKMQLPPDPPKVDLCRGCLMNHVPVHRPLYPL